MGSPDDPVRSAAVLNATQSIARELTDSHPPDHGSCVRSGRVDKSGMDGPKLPRRPAEALCGTVTRATSNSPTDQLTN